MTVADFAARQGCSEDVADRLLAALVSSGYLYRAGSEYLLTWMGHLQCQGAALERADNGQLIGIALHDVVLWSAN